jgi:hypothetical protein
MYPLYVHCIPILYPEHIHQIIPPPWTLATARGQGYAPKEALDASWCNHGVFHTGPKLTVYNGLWWDIPSGSLLQFAIEHGIFSSLIYLLKRVILHSY